MFERITWPGYNWAHLESLESMTLVKILKLAEEFGLGIDAFVTKQEVIDSINEQKKKHEQERLKQERDDLEQKVKAMKLMQILQYAQSQDIPTDDLESKREVVDAILARFDDNHRDNAVVGEKDEGEEAKAENQEQEVAKMFFRNFTFA